MTRISALAIALVLLAPCVAPAAFAQTGDVSGVPLGPGNANGTNGARLDPSGIGNASRIPAIPPPSTAPVPVPSVAPLRSTSPAYTARSSYRDAREWRRLPKRQRQKLERAAVKENDRLLNHGLTSICRGC